MQYRQDTKTGNNLSVLGLGCMRFPRNRLGQFDTEQTERMVRTAIVHGINYFDTAYLYGGSEALLGSILSKLGWRDKVYIATKLPLSKCKVYEDFDRLFFEQLERLQMDYIDYYLLHNMPELASWQRLCDLGIKRWIADKKARGQIRQLGFSFHGAQSEFMALLDVYDWDFCQIQYNYVNVNYQAGQAGLHRAAQKGLPVIVMEPLLGGKLAQSLPDKAMHLFAQTDAQRAPAQWALDWLWNQPEVTVVLSGMSSESQLEENLCFAENATVGMLTPEELAVFGSVEAAFKESFKVACTGCNYCMPCPQGVNIPACFTAYNMSYTVGFISGMQQYLTSTALLNSKRNYSARNCIKCGACEKRCPQNLPIMNDLEVVARKMEPLWVRTAVKIAAKIMR